MSHHDAVSSTGTMEPSDLMERGHPPGGRTHQKSLRGSLNLRAWLSTSSRRLEGTAEGSVQKRHSSMFVSKRRMMPEEVMLDIGDMANYEEADEEECDDKGGRLFVAQEEDEEEGDGGGDVAEQERTGDGDMATSSMSIGSHLLTRNMFVLEVASNRSIRAAISIVYFVFFVSITLEFIYSFDHTGDTFTFPIRAVDDDGPLCVPRSNGTCDEYNRITAAEAVLLANTGVVSDGLNVSDWEGTGAKPGAPPVSAHNVTAGAFLADPSVLDYDANPQLHQYWEDIAAVAWTGVAGGNFHGLRVIFLDLSFQRVDGMDWRAEIADEPFPVRIEGYGCLLGKDCANIGEWRLMALDDEVSLHPVRSVRGTVYNARISIYAHFLGSRVVDSLAWRWAILGDPGGAVSESLVVDENATTVVVKLGQTGDPDIPTVIAVVNVVVLTVYILFILWWSHTLRKRSGRFVQWVTENKWLLVCSIGFVLFVGPIMVGLQLNMTRDDDAEFKEEWWAAALIVSGFGQSFILFVFACFSDAPRRYVTSNLRFYGWKIAFCTVFFVTFALAQLYRFPIIAGWDEPGTSSQLGGIGYFTSPENWDPREQRIMSWLLLLLTIQIIMAHVYYVWANIKSRRVLRELPYSMTRPMQLSSRFFFWVTSLWVLVEFVIIIVLIVQAIDQDQTYHDHMDSRSRLVVALDSKYFLDGAFTHVYNQVFGVIFLIILQCFFLPPDAFSGLTLKERTHYVTEQEAVHGGVQGQPKYLMVLELTRLLMVCSREVYLPFDQSEIGDPVEETSSNEKSDAKYLASKATSAPPVSSTLPDKDEKDVSVKDSGIDSPVVNKNGLLSQGSEPEAPEEKLDSSTAFSVEQSESASEDVEPQPHEGRLAGELGSAPRFLPWESTFAMGCAVVARISEPEGVDMHNTRAIIFRHTESGDLIVSFRGTKTKKQVQTDLMSTKVLVDLDTFLTASRPKRCSNVKNTAQDFEVLSPDVISERIRSGEISKVRLMDLLHKHGHDELPDYLNTATKAQDGIDGVCRIHFGFWSSYNRIRSQLHLTIREELLTRPGRLLITGHSLGGAQATICAYDLSRWVVLTVRKELLKTGGRVLADKIKIVCYNYGSPRVGCRAFKAAYDKMVPNTQRIVHDGDVVTGVPPARLGFRHVGRENIFDRVGSIRVDPSLIEKYFTTQKTAVNPHMMTSYRSVVQKAFNPIMSKEQLLEIIRNAYGYKG